MDEGGEGMINVLVGLKTMVAGSAIEIGDLGFSLLLIGLPIPCGFLATYF